MVFIYNKNMDERSTLTIKPEHAKVLKAILQNLKNQEIDDIKNKAIFEETYQKFSQHPQYETQLIKLRDNIEAKQIFDDFVIQFYCWEEGFKKAVEIHHKQKQIEKLQNFNIRDLLIEIQPKIKIKNPNNSYIVALISIVKKKKLQQNFFRTWKQEKINAKQIRLNQKAKMDQNINNISFESINEKQLIDKNEKDDNNKKKGYQNDKQVSKNKQVNDYKIKKIKEIRLINIIKYLQLKKQFNFSFNKENIAKELFSQLNAFMKDKIHQIIQISKLRVPGYDSQIAGDEFRFYSSKSNNIKIKQSFMIPESDIKIYKVKYPSKFQKYLKLRIQEQKIEQKLKNQLKVKIQSDKKGENKIIQQYVLLDQSQTIHQFQHDQGPKKRQRLIIPSQVIQFVIQEDPWFGDIYAMERTFYRSNV